MKSKTIKQVLRKKFDDFVGTIKDERVKTLVENNSIITGGCITSMLLQEKVNDYDIYFSNRETALAVAMYYVSEYNAEHKTDVTVKDFDPDDTIDPGRVRLFIKSDGVTGMSIRGQIQDLANENQEAMDGFQESVELPEEKGPKYKPVFLSANAITLSNQVQLIVRFHGCADEIHENYDFVHCTNYWTSKDDHLELRKEALEAILTKELRYVGSKYPLCSIIRLRKFIKRQWTVNAGQILKMVMQVSQLDLTDMRVLEDQLVGVDTLYFTMLINALKQAQGDGKEIDALYVCEVVDRMF